MRKIFTTLIIVLMAGTSLLAQVPTTFKNPILSGFYPDPSITRVGDTYYIVNSTFEWFPGLPVHKSKDLVNWELVGYAISRPEQTPFKDGLVDNGGMFAPTIRYHEGLFYVICTAIGAGGNFIVTAK
ncbi:MAG: family 43 glycosylhydrolase, partial [Rikenellaceae bacterium]